MYFDEKICFVMFVYFNPRKLNDLEERRLKEIEISKPEYSKGIKEGFSVVFIGGNKPNYIIKAGKQDDITYYDLFGNIIFPMDIPDNNKK